MSKTLRVRIVHDSSPEDPRDWDDMCEIVHQTHWGKSCTEQIADLIEKTEGWKAVMEMLRVAHQKDIVSHCEDDLLGKLYDDETFRDMWLNAVKGELLVKKFHTQHESYLAHTTPELCKYVGTPWERASEVMDGSIETFKQWAEGDVYGFVIEEWTGACACEECDAGEWIETDSCWGFYGSDPFENGMALHVPEELHDQLREAEVEYKY